MEGGGTKGSFLQLLVYSRMGCILLLMRASFSALCFVNSISDL